MRNIRSGLGLITLGILLSAEIASAQTNFVNANPTPLRTDHLALTQNNTSEQIEQLIQEAEAALQAGELAVAEETLRKILQLDPNDAHAHSALGAALNEQGRYEEAEAALRQAIELNPDDPLA